MTATRSAAGSDSWYWAQCHGSESHQRLSNGDAGGRRTEGIARKTSARQTVRSDRFDEGLCGTEEEALGYSCRRCSSSSKNARQKFLRVRLIEPLGNPRPRSISSRSGFLPTYRMSSSRPEIASGIEASLRPFQTTLRVLLCRRDPSGRSLS